MTEVHSEAAATIERQYVDSVGKSRDLTDGWSVFFKITTDRAGLLVTGGYPPMHKMVIEADETYGPEKC